MEADRTSPADGCPGRRAGGRSPRHQRHRARAQERLTLVRVPARLWSCDNDLYPLCALGASRRLGKPVPRACWEWTIHRHTDDRLHARESAPLGSGWKRGEQKQAVGRSRGGRNTKIHALALAAALVWWILHPSFSKTEFHVDSHEENVCTILRFMESSVECKTEAIGPQAGIQSGQICCL